MDWWANTKILSRIIRSRNRSFNFLFLMLVSTNLPMINHFPFAWSHKDLARWSCCAGTPSGSHKQLQLFTVWHCQSHQSRQWEESLIKIKSTVQLCFQSDTCLLKLMDKGDLIKIIPLIQKLLPLHNAVSLTLSSGAAVLMTRVLESSRLGPPSNFHLKAYIFLWKEDRKSRLVCRVARWEFVDKGDDAAGHLLHTTGNWHQRVLRISMTFAWETTGTWHDSQCNYSLPGTSRGRWSDCLFGFFLSRQSKPGWLDGWMDDYEVRWVDERRMNDGRIDLWIHGSIQ